MILLSLLMLMSCLKTEVLNAPLIRSDTTFTKGIDTTFVDVDTTKVQIGFNPSVNDWQDVEVEI